MFTALISYWWFGLNDPNWYGMLDWMAVLSIPAFLGSLWGFTFGTFFRSEMNALQFNFLFICIFNLGAGSYINVGKGVRFIPWLVSVTSPIRYGTEMLLTRIL